MFKPTIQKVFGLILVIAVLHFWGLERYYYWLFWWYDIVLHSLGGAWIALTLLWFGYERKRQLAWSRLLLVVLAIGVAWELYELWFGLTGTSKAGYLEDTGLDLLFDLVGAGGAALIFSNPFPSRHPSQGQPGQPTPSSPPAHR